MSRGAPNLTRPVPPAITSALPSDNSDPPLTQLYQLLIAPIATELPQDSRIDVGKLLNTAPLLGDQATKKNVLEQMQSATVLHFATHGLLDTIEGDVLGAIALAPSGIDNGFLTSGEIFDLKLKADLVVLSACDTGRGKITGDGVLGLSRSVSLWAVNDALTSIFMNHFYRNLRTSPNKALALRQAMLSTMKQYPNPIDWAAFTLVGER